MTETHTETPAALFTTHTANEWQRIAKQTPVPKMLFGEFWLEGELSILFGDSGVGKSVLAMQIGESIARGRPVFGSPPARGGVAAASADGVVGAISFPRQRVLLLDFELTPKQFEMRYSEDHDPDRGEFLRRHYSFSDRFHRIKVDLNAPVPLEFASMQDFLHSRIEQEIRDWKPRVLIIDSISYLKQTCESTREAIPLMKELNRLKKRYGLSILVLANTPKRDTSRPIVLNDLLGWKLLSNYADNIFAIGQSKLDVSGRYIKHIRPRSTAVFCDASHVPSFRIEKIGGNFLGFRYRWYCSEADHLNDQLARREWQAIEWIKQKHGEGMSIRAIAAELDMSKTRVHRLLHMWPEESGVGNLELGDEYAGSPPYEGGVAAASADGVVLSQPDDDYKPLEEEYRGQHTDWYLVSNGMRPVWKEKWEAEQRMKEQEITLKPSEGNGSVPGESSPPARGGVAGFDSPPGLRRGADASSAGWSADGVVGAATGTLTLPNAETEVDEPELRDAPASCLPSHVSAPNRLQSRLDAYGREIFVESEDPNGKPMVWYQFDPKGNKFRHERKGFAIIGEQVGQISFDLGRAP